MTLLFGAMNTSELVCLFHNRRYSSNIQHILNILRLNIIKIKCDLNLIGKQSLCTCVLSSNEIQITDEEFIKKQNEFQKLQIHQWFNEVDYIIQKKIMNTCNNKLLLYKLLELICEISNEKNVLKTVHKEDKGISVILNDNSFSTKLIERHIDLTLPASQLGHLLGRNGHLHKKIMDDTDTRIHFENAPYSLKPSTNRCPEFDLDLFQSSCTIKAKITGRTLEDVENAIKALEKLDQNTQNNLSRPNQTQTNMLVFD